MHFDDGDCAANLVVWRRPIADKLNGALARFTPYRLLTLPKRKNSLKLYFYFKLRY